MYNELYAAWRREIEERSLGGLPPDFYARIADYLRHINEENKVLDKKSVKVNLLDHEAHNVKRMLEELLWARYRKLVKTITQSKKLPSDLLTVEEAKMCAKDILQGQIVKVAVAAADSRADLKIESKVEPLVSHKRVALRFVKSIPTIIGADMKTYGPFVAEDVASLPVENAKMLVKQGLAGSIEVS
jgi:DNA replication factor GINS